MKKQHAYVVGSHETACKDRDDLRSEVDIACILPEIVQVNVR